MQPKEDLILAFLAWEVVDARSAFFTGRKRSRFLVAKEIGLFLEPVMAAAVAVVGGCGGGWA